MFKGRYRLLGYASHGESSRVPRIGLHPSKRLQSRAVIDGRAQCRRILAGLASPLQNIPTKRVLIRLDQIVELISARQISVRLPSKLGPRIYDFDATDKVPQGINGDTGLPEITG